MQQQIIPSNLLETLTEYHLFKNTSKSQAIYIVIVFSILTIAVALPFIYVNITVQGIGIIRPVIEKTEVKSVISGIVSEVMIKEGESVKAGQTLIKFFSNNIDSKINYVKFQQIQAKIYIRDLEHMVSKMDTDLHSSIYIQQLNEYKEKVSEYNNKIRKARKELNRNEGLYKNQMISEKEYDDLKYQLSLLENELKSFSENTMSTWQSKLAQYNTSLQELSSQAMELLKEKDLCEVKAPYLIEVF